MGRTGGLLHHGLLQHGLPDNGLPDNGLLDGRQVIDRLLLAGGRLVCGLVPGGLPPGSGGDSCSCSSGTDGAGGALSSSLPQAAASKASMLTAANILTYISLI